jgi:hypothetical protein
MNKREDPRVAVVVDPHKTHVVIKHIMGLTSCHVLQMKLSLKEMTASITIQIKHLNVTQLYWSFHQEKPAEVITQ